MKPRRVILTVEVETAWPLKDMKAWVKEHFTNSGIDDAVIEVVQIQANVIREKPKKRGNNADA